MGRLYILATALGCFPLLVAAQPVVGSQVFRSQGDDSQMNKTQSVGSLGDHQVSEGQIGGMLLSAFDKAPVSGAAVMDMDGTFRTSSNPIGKFTLPLKDTGLDHRILISALGHRDTILKVSSLVDRPNEDIVLGVKLWVLPVVEVLSVSKSRKTFAYGDTAIPVKTGSGLRTDANPKAGWLYFGVMVAPVKKHQGGVLTSLSVYVSPEGNPTRPFQIRFLVCPPGMRTNKGEKTHLFMDMNKIPIVFSAEKPGWNELDLRAYDIVVPSGPFMMMFVPVDGTSDRKGATIGVYEDTKAPDNFFLAIGWDDLYSYTSKGRSFGVAAVVLRGEK